MYGFGSCTVAFLPPPLTVTPVRARWVTFTMPRAAEECRKFHIVWKVIPCIHNITYFTVRKFTFTVAVISVSACYYIPPHKLQNSNVILTHHCDHFVHHKNVASPQINMNSVCQKSLTLNLYQAEHVLIFLPNNDIRGANKILCHTKDLTRLQPCCKHVEINCTDLLHISSKISRSPDKS